MTPSHDTHEVRHEPDRSRFTVATDDGVATANYTRSGDTITLKRTKVPPEAEGGGVGGALARAAFDHAREEGLRVRLECPFMRSWAERHPEYEDLIDDDRG